MPVGALEGRAQSQAIDIPCTLALDEVVRLLTVKCMRGPQVSRLGDGYSKDLHTFDHVSNDSSGALT